MWHEYILFNIPPRVWKHRRPQPANSSELKAAKRRVGRDELVSELIEDNQLAYGSNNMLMLTPKGRLTILNDQADYLSFDGKHEKEGIIHPENALSLDEVYVPAGFMSKLK